MFYNESSFMILRPMIAIHLASVESRSVHIERTVFGGSDRLMHDYPNIKVSNAH